MGDKEAIEIMKGQGMTQAEAEDALKGIKDGVRDFEEGRIVPLNEVLKELGLDTADGFSVRDRVIEIATGEKGTVTRLSPDGKAITVKWDAGAQQMVNSLDIKKE